MIKKEKIFQKVELKMGNRIYKFEIFILFEIGIVSFHEWHS